MVGGSSSLPLGRDKRLLFPRYSLQRGAWGQWWSFIEKFLIKRNHCIFTSQQQLPEREEECRRVIEMEYRTKKWLNVKWLQFFKSERTEWQRKVTECESRNCDLGNNGILVKRITTIIIIIISRYIGICFLFRGCSTCFELYDRGSSVTSLRRCRRCRWNVRMKSKQCFVSFRSQTPPPIQWIKSWKAQI